MTHHRPPAAIPDPDAIEQVRRGDEAAFRRLIEAHTRELRVHCYRMSARCRTPRTSSRRPSRGPGGDERPSRGARRCGPGSTRSPPTTASISSRAGHAASLLQRLFRHGRDDAAGRRASDAEEQAVLDRYVRVWDDRDVSGLVALLKEDAILTMPPIAAWYRGRDAIVWFLSTYGFGQVTLRFVRTSANGRPALAAYAWDLERTRFQAVGLMVVTIEDGLIATMIAFGEPALFRWFGLPTELPASRRHGARTSTASTWFGYADVRQTTMMLVLAALNGSRLQSPYCRMTVKPWWCRSAASSWGKVYRNASRVTVVRS